MLDSELPLFRSAGYDLRQTVQYRWINRNPNTGQMYSDFEEYLSCFKSKRRVEIKRERKQVKEQGIRMEVFRGDDPRATRELFETIHDIYATTIEKMWGQQYLSKQFFSMLSDASINFKRKIVFVLAYNENDRIVAGTFNLASETHFYGRYWGAFEYIKHLHFEACYYAAIEFCIQNRVLYMEPGAGGGEYKFLRGFDPFLIHSVHYFTNPTMQAAVAEFLVQEREINKVLNLLLLILLLLFLNHFDCMYIFTYLHAYLPLIPNNLFFLHEYHCILGDN